MFAKPRALRKRPSNAEAAARYADAQRRVAEAQQLIDDAVAKAPAKSAAVLIEAAEALIHYTNKDLDKAKTLLDRALTIEPKNPEIHLLLGDIYTELNNGTLAADYYNKALDYNKTSARGIVSKGACTNVPPTTKARPPNSSKPFSWIPTTPRLS